MTCLLTVISQCVWELAHVLINTANISVQDGQELNWVQSCRYLGITGESASHFKCNIGEAKKSFYRSFNAVFGRVDRIARENVTVELLMKKCLPTLLYATEVCLLNKSDITVLDYVVESALKKIFDTNSKLEIILKCRLMFELNSVGDVLLKRQRNFLFAYMGLDNNLICRSITALSAKWLLCRSIALR